ncbi:sugar phosphate isomerase/epimerase family protein [Parapedomonas caeni]
MMPARPNPWPIALASGVLPEFSPVATVEAAAAAGFDGVGLWFEAADWTAATTRAVRAALAATGMPALDIEVVWLKPGADDPEHFRLLDVGAELGARNVLTVSSDPDRGATVAKFARLCEHAAPLGLRVSLEFMMFTEVRTIDDALDVLARAAQPNAGLLLDPIHLSRSGGTPADIARVAPALLGYAQFCDAPAQAPPRDDTAAILEEAIDGRLLPGDGALPLGDFLDRLPAGLPLSIELRSKALREGYPDAVDRARALATATRAYLAGR